MSFTFNNGNTHIFGTKSGDSEVITLKAAYNQVLAIEGTVITPSGLLATSIDVTGTTDSTSTTTGSIKTAGGLGVAKKITAARAEITDTTASTSVSTGSLINDGGFGNAGRIWTTDLTVVGPIVSNVSTGTAPFTVASTTQVANLNAATAGSATTATSATNATNASAVNITNDVSTNVAVYPTWVVSSSGNNQVGCSNGKLAYNPSTGILSSTNAAITNTTSSSSKTTGSLINSGGFGNAGAIFTDTLTSTNTSEAITPTTGSIICLGGIGCSKAMFANNVRTNATTSSTSTSTGSIVSAGGIGCAERIFANDITVVNNNYANVYRSSSVSINNATWTNPFTGGLGTVSNNGSVSSTTSGVVTVNLAGLYLVSYGTTFASNTTGVRGVSVFSSSNWNGTPQYGKFYNLPNSFYETPMASSIVVYCPASTTFQLNIFQNSGAGLSTTYSFITVARVVG